MAASPDTPTDATGRSWAAAARQALEDAEELRIATRRPDGTLRAWVPIWVVIVDGEAYVRTWHRRTRGWFGHAVADRRARVRAPGLETDVDVDDVGDLPVTLRRAIDQGFAVKYLARHGRPSIDKMTDDSAAAATLRLRPRSSTP